MFRHADREKLQTTQAVVRWAVARLRGSKTVNKRTKIREDTRFRVLSLLQENPNLSQRNLAKASGVSLGSLNYCLRALMQEGFVKMKNFSGSNNKFGYFYLLTPRGMAERSASARRFLQRKIEEYELLRREIEQVKKDFEV